MLKAIQGGTELLPATEAALLADLEDVIQRGLSTFVDVGNALRKIRDSPQLYRPTYGTFEDYCRERWDLARSTAYQKIDAAKVVSAMADIAPPQNERQARALVPLLDQPEKLQRAWELASGGGAPTAAKVKEAVQWELPTPKRKRPVADEAFGRDLAKFERQAHRLTQRAERAAKYAMQPVLDGWFGHVRELQRTLDEMERIILKKEVGDE